MKNTSIELVTISHTIPHPTEDLFEIVSFKTVEGWLWKTVAAKGKYPKGTRARFYRPGASLDNRWVKAKLIYGVYSNGELELIDEQSA